MKTIEDDFRGDNDALCASIQALIQLGDANALVPIPLGGHARSLLAAAYHRLKQPLVTSSDFTNELGNAIRITIEGPTSKSENVLTPKEVFELRDLLNQHFPVELV